ncbi:MAG: hypothetical protein H7A43_03435 [Verrucomicrobia bacterium]|nr:hypothetical protein [Verrucomicrobiota bacterium]
MTTSKQGALIALSLVLAAMPTVAGMKEGRALDGDKTFSIRLLAGQLDGVSGTVEETKRAGTDAITDEGRFLETYSFEELGFDESYATYGIELEKNWSFFTLHLDLKHADISGESTARRIYAIGVEQVLFNGSDYEYMLIPEGTTFQSDMETLALDLKLKWTPFHFVSEERWISFSPWILVGLYAVGADFSVDAGPPQGVTTYETDPYPYVIGGRGEGQVGALLPEIGVGGEFRFGLWEMNGDRAELALQIEYAFMDVAANTGDFGINSRNEKNIDTAFHNLDLRAQFELPLNENLDLLFGAGLKRIEVDATIEADRTPPDQRTTEKYDKTAELQMDYIYLFGGLKF